MVVRALRLGNGFAFVVADSEEELTRLLGKPHTPDPPKEEDAPTEQAPPPRPAPPRAPLEATSTGKRSSKGRPILRCPVCPYEVDWAPGMANHIKGGRHLPPKGATPPVAMPSPPPPRASVQPPADPKPKPALPEPTPSDVRNGIQSYFAGHGTAFLEHVLGMDRAKRMLREVYRSENLGQPPAFGFDPKLKAKWTNSLAEGQYRLAQRLLKDVP